MAIITDNEKLALISYHQNWNTPIPISSDIGNDGDKQHLIWEYPGISWGAAIGGGSLITIFYHHYQLQRST
jgi:hypothetical protein